MKILGIIAEYNPFHLGHKYHIEKSIEKTDADATIAIMSGSFVQRGEPAALDKWSRAKMAIDNGVDLVIELPFIYACQTAEIFAEGGVRLLDSLNIIDYISFGSELGKIDDLNLIAHTLVDEPFKFKKSLLAYLESGKSFPVSRSKAIEDYHSEILNIKEIMSSSNNILAIEYLKALYKYDSEIKPVTISRVGSNYNDKNLSNKFASATGIRESIYRGNIDSIVEYMDDTSYSVIEDFIKKEGKINRIEEYEDILIYLLRIVNNDSISHISDARHGIGNRILNNSKKYKDIENIINQSISKTHTRSRIQRILIHLLADLSKDSFLSIDKYYPNYIRVLAANKSGLKLLRQITRNSKLPIITKFSDYKKLNNKEINKIIEYEKKATDLFYLPFKNNTANMDFYTSPYIKK